MDLTHQKQVNNIGWLIIDPPADLEKKSEKIKII